MLILAQSAYRRSAPADGNGACDRARPRAQRVPVIARFDHPLPVLAADDLTDVMRPHHHRADAGCAGMAPMRPVAGEVVRRAGIAADQLAHRPAAPGGRPASPRNTACRTLPPNCGVEKDAACGANGAPKDVYISDVTTARLLARRWL